MRIFQTPNELHDLRHSNVIYFPLPAKATPIRLTKINKNHRAAIGINIFLVYIGILVLPKPSIYRPHGVFWRLIQSLAFTYLINITFLLFFSKENLDYILQEIVDPSLKTVTIDTDYALDCRIYTPENPESNFANIVGCFDVYIVCHLIGWLVKSGIFRNQVFGWCLSIGFELLELTFRYWLANFNECWWDSLI
jgi:phosphatidylserine synthase 2